jgi:hypothetical protein
MASVTYLDLSRNSTRYSKLDDYYILRAALKKSYHLAERPPLEPDKFTESYDLKRTPKQGVSDEAIQEALDYRGVEGISFPQGATFQQQCDSLVPADTPGTTSVKESWDSTEVRRALIHFLGRQVVGLPEELPSIGVPDGLDFLSAALVQIHYLSVATGNPVRWLNTLQEIQKSQKDAQEAQKDRQSTATFWQQRTLRMDGPINHTYEWLLSGLRKNIRALLYRPIRVFTEKYNQSKHPVRVRQNEIMETLDLPRTRAKRAYDHIQLMLTERFIPSLPTIGVRYRCVIGSDRRLARPIGTLCEHIAWQKDEEDKWDYGTLNIYLEPLGADRPTSSDEFVITADTETISFRTDLFDHTIKYGEERGTWESGDETDELSIGRTKGWILRKSPKARRYGTMTESERNLLSVLWTHQGSPEQREHLISLMDFPVRGLRHAKSSFKKRVPYSVMYYPSVEYCAIPLGLMIAARIRTKRKMEEASHLILTSYPFVRLLTGNEGMLAIVRVPYGGHGWMEYVSHPLREMGIEHKTAICDSQRTFYATALSRLYSDAEDGWRDPWK